MCQAVSLVEHTGEPPKHVSDTDSFALDLALAFSFSLLQSLSGNP